MSAPAMARGPVIEEICDRLRREGGEEVDLLCAFTREFFSKAPRQLAQDRSIDDLAALTKGAFRFLKKSRPEDVNVEVLNPEAESWSAPVTLVRAEVGDRPFIVDTIREYLSAENLAIQHYIYPVLGVSRGANGEIVHVGEPAEGRPEALVHCEISRIDDVARQEAIRSEIERRLTDVVAATDDFEAMLGEVGDVIAEAEANSRGFPARQEEFEEISEFLNWLRDENFVFLGYRSYEIAKEGAEAELRVAPGSGLGVLRSEDDSRWAGGVKLSEVPNRLRQRISSGPSLIVSKTNAEATVHRRARMDYIGVKRYDDQGQVVGERRFLGLFTSKAYNEHADVIPILRNKLRRILENSGAAPGSHDYKEIITIFNSMPKEDLFQASTTELAREVQTVLSLLFSDEIQVSLRPDPLGRGVSVLVILPRGKFSGDVRQRIQEALSRRYSGTILNYHLAMSAGDQARLHFYISAPDETLERVTSAEIEADIRKIIRSWDDRLQDELVRVHGQTEGQRLARLYAPTMSEEYRAATLPEVAVTDIVEFERLAEEARSVAIALREPRGRGRADVFRGLTLLKLYLRGERLILSDFMPILDNAGLRVVEVTPFAFIGEGLPDMMIYAFAVEDPKEGPLALERADLLAEALLAVRDGETPNDAFNALVIRAGLRWREVDVLRTFANYAFQAGTIPTRYGPAGALIRHPELARLLVDFFGARFDPRRAVAGGAEARRIRERISAALEQVTTLADDRAIRRLVVMMEATTRTNYFRHGGADPTFRSGGVPYISIKIRCADVEELRRNRLLFEIYVFSARMEGIHLRAAPVSRGGIRWSDRPDDFRKEVLGLVQTQIVKNSVIVPGGSKGGFITKLTFADREEALADAADQYRTLVRGMLDITDNLIDGEVVPPEGVVRYDGDDPYLVVAADKGTAHLPDVANGVAAEYGFWLDDAFASGGSHGYDHKKLGITARGAWESVRRHFWEMGKDVQTEPFTVVGIGDMSGDVFGNGMLRSRQIKLVAAFDHRHIFIDPDPDPELSYQERERLFRTPRSSWDDYDRAKLSAGAMIVPRASKEIELTPEARAVLGVSDDVDRLDGEGLVRAVLCAPAELLWNGGIGTYVKDREETHAQVGDTTNDPVRVNADELRCKVVGEGGNLGFTQQARMTFARNGGRNNTDALDNSGGVDMSDHEVNIKILLNPRVAAGEMELDARNELLERMTDDVSRLVLSNNTSQSRAISLDEARSRDALGDFTALISALERERLIERTAEGIPSADQIADRSREGLGLTRPTLCLLLSYAKLQAASRLLDSHLPDDPATQSYLIGYFPQEAVETVGLDRLAEHRLRREIITTQLINELVDLMGASFLHRVARDSGQEIDAVVRAWFVASEISGARDIRSDVARLEGKYPAATLYRWLFALGRVLERTTRWILTNLSPEADTQQVIDEHRNALGQLRSKFAELVRGSDREVFADRITELRELGVDDHLATRLITLRFLPEMMDILRIARESGADAVETASAYYRVTEFLATAWLQQMLRAAGGDDVWEKRLVQGLVADVARTHRAIAQAALDCSRGKDIDTCIAELEQRRSRELHHYFEILEDLRAADSPSLAGCAVAVRSLARVLEG